MPIDLQDLYQPISDFFMTTFGTATRDVVFRFDQFGSVISDQDFIDDRHPEAGPSAGLANEKFSDLVNRVPLDAGDGLHVILGQASIDEVYNFQLLLPAVPQVPSQADTFNAVKAAATSLWTKLTLQSLSGLMLDYKPSVASPEDWYDSRSSQSWTAQSFHIASSPVAAATPPVPVWRLRLSDEQIVEKLELPPEARQPGPALRERMLRAERLTSQIQPLLMAARPELATSVSASALRVSPSVGAALGEGEVHRALVSEIAGLNIRQRIAVNETLEQVTPTAPSSTSSVTVSFEYCLVQIRRPWWFDSFVDNPSWSVPGVAPGSLTASGNPAGISWLPVAFAAVRNLRVEAVWSPDDAVNASQATGFGPFRVEMDAGSQSLVHPGIQVAGWVLQRLPSLPPAPLSTPVDPPPATALQVYVVQAGDTLGRIAQHFWGDAGRWPEIQQANHLANPDLINVGDRLTIPAFH